MTTIESEYPLFQITMYLHDIPARTASDWNAFYNSGKLFLTHFFDLSVSIWFYHYCLVNWYSGSCKFSSLGPTTNYAKIVQYAVLYPVLQHIILPILRHPDVFSHLGHVTILLILEPISQEILGLETSGFRHSNYNKPLFPISWFWEPVTTRALIAPPASLTRSCHSTSGPMLPHAVVVQNG